MRQPLAADHVAALTDVLQFMRLLWALDHALQAASKRMQRALGVTGPQRLAIRVVGRVPGVSAGAVAAILHLHPSTVTGVLRRLEADGLISREPDPADRRRTILQLTPRGRSLDQLQAGTVEAAVRKALRHTSADEQASVRAVLTRLTERLEEISAAAEPGGSRVSRGGRRDQQRVRAAGRYRGRKRA